MNLEQALATVKAAGYRVSKPKAKAAAPTLNALGKPYGPGYDPNYRMKYRTPPLKRAQSVGAGLSPEQWAQMCKLSQAMWDQRAKAAEKAEAEQQAAAEAWAKAYGERLQAKPGTNGLAYPEAA